MDKPNIVACRHSFLVIRNSMPKNYLAIKKNKKSRNLQSNSFIHVFTCSQKWQDCSFSSLEGRGRKLEGTSFISLALIIIRMLNLL